MTCLPYNIEKCLFTIPSSFFLGMDGNDMLAKWRRDWENEDGTIFGAGGEGRERGGRGGREEVIEVDETGIRGGVRQQYIPYLYPQRWASKLIFCV